MPNEKQINIRNIPADLLKRAQGIAREQDLQLSQVVRSLLREYVAEHEQKLSKGGPTKHNKTD